MKSFEELCDDLRAFAHGYPEARRASVSDTAAYGAGMDAIVAMRKLKALADYARHEWKIELFVRNDRDEAILPMPELAGLSDQAKADR